MSSIGPVVSEEMFENVDERMDDGVTGILLAHQRAFRSGELKTCMIHVFLTLYSKGYFQIMTSFSIFDNIEKN